MLTIDVNLLNNPVLITCPTQRLPSEQREYDHLTGYVLLNSDRRRCIGGVRVVWAVTVEQARIVRAAAGRHGAQVHHEDEEQDNAVGIGEGGGKSRGLWSGKESRRQKGKGKAKKGEGKWGEKVVIDEYEVDVVGPMYFEAGETRLEFGISVRPEIACSRVTRFDRIQHTLHGSILAAPPGYESLFPASSLPSKYEERSVDSGRRDSTVTSCATSGRRSSSTPSSAPSMYDGDAPPYEASLHGYSNPDESSTNIPLRPDSAVARCQHSVGAVDTGPGLLARWKNRFFPTRGPPSAAGSGSSGESTGVDRSATDQADGVLARCQRVVLLWSLDISGEYNWTHSQTVPKLGGAGVNLAISSEATDWCKSLKIQLVLGGAVTGTVHLTDIPEDMTIHAITFDLTQTTLAPREFPASAAGDDGSEREPERPSVVDEWTLAEQGVVPASKLAGRKLHSPPIAVKGKKGSFSSAVTFDLWRHGHTAYSSPAPKQGSPLHSSVPSTDLLIRLPGRLPSPLLGASSTNDHPGHPPLPPCPPSPATRSSLCAQVLISHEWSFTIHFSQLGTDADGEPLTAEHYAVKTAPKGTEPRTLEGAVRTWKLAKGVVVGSDLAISPGMVAPTYANSSDVEDNPTGTETDRGESLHPERSARPARPEIDIGIGNAKSHRVTRRPGQPATPCKRESMISDWHNNKSISLPQRRSHIMGNWTFLRAVQRDEREMRREVGAHWDETGGMCACFRDHGEGPMKSRGDEGGSGRAAVVKTSQGS